MQMLTVHKSPESVKHKILNSKFTFTRGTPNHLY